MNTPKKLQQRVEATGTKAQPQSMNAADLDSLAIEVAENEGWPVNPDKALPKRRRNEVAFVVSSLASAQTRDGDLHAHSRQRPGKSWTVGRSTG